MQNEIINDFKNLVQKADELHERVTKLLSDSAELWEQRYSEKGKTTLLQIKTLLNMFVKYVDEEIINE